VRVRDRGPRLSALCRPHRILDTVTEAEAVRRLLGALGLAAQPPSGRPSLPSDPLSIAASRPSSAGRRAASRRRPPDARRGRRCRRPCRPSVSRWARPSSSSASRTASASFRRLRKHPRDVRRSPLAIAKPPRGRRGAVEAVRPRRAPCVWARLVSGYHAPQKHVKKGLLPNGRLGHPVWIRGGPKRPPRVSGVNAEVLVTHVRRLKTPVQN
jgi:hypothetical protein